jgi:hypothetical protein
VQELDRKPVVDKLAYLSLLDPGFWDQRTQRKGISFALLSSFLPQAMKARGSIRVRRMHQEVRKLVKHHQQLLDPRQSAVDGDEMPSLHAVIEDVRPQGHLDYSDLKSSAQAVKIVFAERSLVPTDP